MSVKYSEISEKQEQSENTNQYQTIQRTMCQSVSEANASITIKMLKGLKFRNYTPVISRDRTDLLNNYFVKYLKFLIRNLPECVSMHIFKFYHFWKYLLEF